MILAAEVKRTRSLCRRMDHEETRYRLVVDERLATLAPYRRLLLSTNSRYVQSRSKRQVTADTSSIGAIIGGGPVVAAAGPAMRRWARRGCCYPSTPDQRWEGFETFARIPLTYIYFFLLFFFFIKISFRYSAFNYLCDLCTMFRNKIFSWKD